MSDFKFLPLRTDIKVAAEKAGELSDKVYSPLMDSFSRFDEKSPVRPIEGESISFKLISAETAKSAASVLIGYQKMRSRLKYRLRTFEARERELSVYKKSYGSRVRVHIDDYLPNECEDLHGEILWAAAHYCPITLPALSAMESFTATFASFDILSISMISSSETPDFRDIVTLHKSFLTLATLVVATVLDHKPIDIEIDGSVRHLSVSIDKNPVRLSPMQVRGVVALALLEYDHWFSVDDFCKLITPIAKDRGEPRKEFDAALNTLKKFPPFGWDADEGIRRITGAVVKSLVDKAVLQAFLNQKKNS